MERDESFFTRVFEVSPEAILILDANDSVLGCNAAAALLQRTAREKLIGAHIQTLLPTCGGEGATPLAMAVAGAPREFETDCCTADGAILPVFVRASIITNGSQPAVLVYIRDLSERKRLESRLNAATDASNDLALRVQGRTEALARTNEALRTEVAERHAADSERRRLETQLRSAQRMEAVGRLAGGVAHDFNNLLTVIIGRSEIMLDQISGNHPMLPDLMLVHDAAQKASQVTRQLLALGRKEAIHPRILDLNEVIGGMKAMLLSLITENIRFVLELDPSTLRIEADRGQIEQVILNLVVNSLDAMSGGGTLEIKTTNALLGEDLKTGAGPVTPGSYAVFSVRDTGKGMDPETLARVFEPYFTTKEASKGTGLGLSTVQGIVQQSGGCIFVSSEEARGTAFRVCLPGRENLPEPVDTAPHPAPSGAETILVVEDAHVVRMLTRELLEGRGYVVIEASNGEEALSACRYYGCAINLMLTDITMPDMNGHELAQQAAAMLPGLKVLLMSGHTDEITRSQIASTGYPFIAKPFTLRALAAKVRESLDA